MRFALLCHLDPERLSAITPEEGATIDAAAMAYDAQLIASGHYVTALALADASDATLVRVRKGALSTTDGPHAETKEVLGGLVIIEALDVAEAASLAALSPLAAYGTIEVRPELGRAWQKDQQGRL